MLYKRLYHAEPPDARDRQDDNPTLLISWWCTSFALAAILVRVGGRYVRTERLFKEDKIMFLSVIPLLLRMAFVHVVMIWGTNNAKTQGLSPLDIHHRVVGSRLVLASRIFYAAFIWTAKLTVLEFLKRVVGVHWTRRYQIGLRYIRYFLAVTFVVVVIATLAECQPFDHYWQVVPDPGPRCREGLAQLIAMGVCDIITDILLVVFPIPIVMASAMPLTRKLALTLLFMLSLGLVGITAYRVPAVVSRKGSQQFRTLLASLEILAATAVANAIVITSFIRDRGLKKAKFKFGSANGSTLDRPPTRRTNTTVTLHQWGSDADLASDIGIGLQPELQSRKGSVPRPAPIATPRAQRRRSSATRKMSFLHKHDESSDSDTEGSKLGDEEAVSPLSKPGEESYIDNVDTPRKMNFFDVGGLLEQSSPVASSRRSSTSHSTFTAVDFGSRPSSVANSVTPLQPQTQTYGHGRRPSRPLIGEIGRLLSAHEEEDLLDPRSPPDSTHEWPLSPTNTRNNAQRTAASSAPMNSSGIAGREDTGGLAHTMSRGTTNSLMSALATNPPGFRAANQPITRGPGQPDSDDGPPLNDAGGLLR